MTQKYDWPDKIPDEAIKEAFTSANSVSFSARPFNTIKYRSIAFGDLGWWLSLAHVLPLIGITPQMLRPVFNRQRVLVGKERRIPVRRSLPLNLLEKFGVLKKKYEDKVDYQIEEIELPETIETYEQLGSFQLAANPFLKLAQILDKSIEVMREDGGTGEHYHLFTVHPSGEIVEATKT